MLIWMFVKRNTAVYYSVHSHVRSLCYDKLIELQKGTHKNGTKKQTKIVEITSLTEIRTILL